MIQRKPILRYLPYTKSTGKPRPTVIYRAFSTPKSCSFDLGFIACFWCDSQIRLIVLTSIFFFSFPFLQCPLISIGFFSFEFSHFCNAFSWYYYMQCLDIHPRLMLPELYLLIHISPKQLHYHNGLLLFFAHFPIYFLHFFFPRAK